MDRLRLVQVQQAYQVYLNSYRLTIVQYVKYKKQKRHLNADIGSVMIVY